MRFGTAKDLITPTEPTMLACTGSYDKTYTEIHDDIFVRCIVIDDGNKKSVIMSFDLIFHDRTLNAEIEKYANERGIKVSEHVLGESVHSADDIPALDEEIRSLRSLYYSVESRISAF